MTSRGIGAIKPGTGVIYFAAYRDFDNETHIKVGCTAQKVSTRLRCVFNPKEYSLLATVPGDGDLESLIHERLRDSRVRSHFGRYPSKERFRPTPDVLAVCGAAMRGPSALAEELAR